MAQRGLALSWAPPPLCGNDRGRLALGLVSWGEAPFVFMAGSFALLTVLASVPRDWER